MVFPNASKMAVPAGLGAKPKESQPVPSFHFTKMEFRFTKMEFRFTKMDICVDFFFRAVFSKMGFRAGRGRLAKVLK